MYCLSDQQIEYMLADIKKNGVAIEDLQLNLLDHICCIIEQNMKEGDDFEVYYKKTLMQFYKLELREIEEETINLLTFKNYYTMKKVMINSGTVSATAFILGSLFKIMHWPGANILLVLGIATISLLFLPLLFILKTKEAGTSRDKLIVGLGTLVGILFCIAVLFTVLHWPGATVLWYSTIIISGFIFIPIYFFSGIRNPETKVNTIVSTILLLVATGLHFTLINTRPGSPEIKMYNYIQSERLLENMLGKTVGNKHAYSEEDKVIHEIQNDCEQIKGLILNNDIGQKSLPKDFESKNIIINERNVGGDFYNDPSGLKLLTELKAAVIKYNSMLTINEENQIPVENSILNVEQGKIGSYTNLFVLNSLTLIQMYLANSQNKMVATK